MVYLQVADLLTFMKFKWRSAEPGEPGGAKLGLMGKNLGVYKSNRLHVV